MLLCPPPWEQVVAKLFFMTVETYHMNIAFDTISLGCLLKILELKLINNMFDSLNNSIIIT